MSWNTPSNEGLNITSYLIKKSTDLYNWTDSLSNTTSFKAVDLSNNTKYYFIIRARNIAGFGLESNIIIGTTLQVTNTSNKIESITITPSNTFIDLSQNIQYNTSLDTESNIIIETPIKQVANIPSKIESITITPGNTFIDLSWNTPYNRGIDITSYLIQKSIDLSNWVDLSSSTTSFKVSNLSNNITYYFIVRARNNNGLGPESNIFSGIPKIVAPATQVPDAQVPVTQVPATQVPATQVPATQVPNIQVPNIQVPNIQIPNIQTLLSNMFNEILSKYDIVYLGLGVVIILLLFIILKNNILYLGLGIVIILLIFLILKK